MDPRERHEDLASRRGRATLLAAGAAGREPDMLKELKELALEQVDNLRRLIDRKEAEAPPPAPEVVLPGEIRDRLRKRVIG